MSSVRLARGLKKKGFRVVLIYNQTGSTQLRQIEQEFEIISLAYKNLFSRVIFLGRFLRNRKPDVLISNLMRNNLVSAVACLFSGFACKLLLVERAKLDYTLTSGKGWGNRFIKKVLSQFAPALLYRRAHKIIAVSSAVAKDISQLLKIPQTDVAVIYNPVVSDDFMLLSSQQLDHPWLRKREEPVVLAAGRLSWEKGFDVLIKSVALIKKKRSIKVIILGGGPEKQNLESLAHSLDVFDDIDFLGPVENILPYIGSADLFVVPSRSEGFCNVLAEALACGTPVVSTDCGGPREILEDGRFGALVPVDDPLWLSNAIIDSLNRSHDREQLKQRGFFFSTENAVERYVGLFNESNVS